VKKIWDHQGIINSFEANRNPELAMPMSAYMRYQFDFLGIKTPLRNELLKNIYQRTNYLLERN